jgi:hypothetical protein
VSRAGGTHFIGVAGRRMCIYAGATCPEIMWELLGGVLLPCYALFGEGHFAVANAMHYGAGCLSAPARVALALAGLLAWPLLLWGCGRYWVPRPRTKVRHAPLLAHALLATHTALSAVDAAHVVPPVLLLVAQLCLVRHDTSDALGAVCVASLLGLAMVFWGAAAGVHDNRREIPCETGLAAGALLLGGALYAHPATALWLALEASPTALATVLAVHAALVVGLHDGLVWVPTLLAPAYVDMLIGGVSAHETWALVAQISLAGLTAVAHVWLLVRLVTDRDGVPLPRVLTGEAYVLTVFGLAGVGLFLRHLGLLALVCVQGAVLGATLACHLVSSAPSAGLAL